MEQQSAANAKTAHLRDNSSLWQQVQASPRDYLTLYWHHEVHNNFLEMLRSISIIMISSTFKTFSYLLFPKLLFLLTIVNFLNTMENSVEMP